MKIMWKRRKADVAKNILLIYFRSINIIIVFNQI